MVKWLKREIRRYGSTGVVVILVATPFVFSQVFANSVGLSIKVLVALAFVLLAAGYHYFKDVKPLVDFETKKGSIIERNCDPVLDALRKFDDTARLSIMEIDWALIRPNSRSKFKAVHTFNMQDAPDVDLNPGINQGPWGQARDSGEFHVADLEKADRASYSLDEGQWEKMEDLSLVFSMPIKKEEKKQDNKIHITTEVIGMVNIDSSGENALAFYEQTKIPGTNKTLKQEVEEVMIRISEVCSWVMSR